MREGLRSWTRSGKVSSDGKVVHKGRVCVKNASDSFVLGDEGFQAPLLIEKKDNDNLVSCDEGLEAPTLLIEKKDEDLVSGDDGLPTSLIEKKDEDLVSGDEGLEAPTPLIEKKDEDLVSGGEGLEAPTLLIEKKDEVLVSGDEGLEAPTSMIQKEDKVECAGEVDCVGEVECAVKKTLDLDLNASPSVDIDLAENESCLDLKLNMSGNVDLAENVNSSPRSCLKDGGINVEAEDDWEESEGLSGARVLRLRLKREDDKKSDNGGNDVAGNIGEPGGFDELKEADGILTDGNEIEGVKVKMGGKGKRKLKRKRGRPPKTEIKEKDEFVYQHQPPRKVGRPPKTVIKERGQLVDQPLSKLGRPLKEVIKEDDQLVQSPRKRGRPPKTDQQKYPITVSHNSKGKASHENGKKVSSKKFKKKRTSNTVNAPAAKQRKRREQKQLVSNQIMACLSDAGWTVDHRPRKSGRDYFDAVYVSLDGKTHWSITLAYKRLKERYEAGDGEGKLYRPGFKFTPIPEEDFKLLTRVVTKKRCSVKCVPFEGKVGKNVDGVNRKEKKIKPGSGAGKGKSVKGKMKRKRSLAEDGDTDFKSPNRLPVLVRDRKRHKTQNKTRGALLVRDATEEVDSEINGYVPYSGKRTILAWMIDLGTIPQNGKVYYMQDKLEIAPLEGKITGDGIHCGCCNSIITVSDFGVHAKSKQSDPLKNIYTEDETSLLQCLLDSWNKQDESERKSFHFVDVAGEDPNDDTCGICGDGGDLMCCDGCPSTFHKSCLDIKKFPSGDWHCIYCCCKFCGLVGGSSNRSVVNDEFTLPALLTCHLCEEKFHKSCIEANGGKTDDSGDAVFCGNKCQELSEGLERLLGVKHEIEDGFSWSFIWRSDVGVDASLTKPQLVECNSKLAVALSIMNECFMPFIDHRSGTNLIHSIVYNCGSNFKRLNYSGFITAFLERGDEIICVASIRIHGNQLAEMPFIGTRYMYRRQGMCRRLLNAIEWALDSLHVELLIIPAISELKETWTSVFGFEPLDQTSKQITKSMNLLVFPHVDMLQKKISKHEFTNENLIPTEVSNHMKNHTTCKVANRDGKDSTGSDCCKKIDISLNNTPDITSDVQNIKSTKDVTSPDACQTVHGQLVVDNKSTENAGERVADSCCQVGDYDGALLEVTENCSNKVKVTTDVGLNNISAEKSALSGAENIPIDSQVVFRTRESKYSAESNHDSHRISDSCELRFKTDCAQSDGIASEEVHTQFDNGCSTHSVPDGDIASGVAGLLTNILMNTESQNITQDLPVSCENNSSVSVPNADEAELCYSKTIDLQTNKNPGDCQSILVSSGICKKIADGVNETNKASSEADTVFLPADIEVILDDKPGSHSRSNGRSVSNEAGLTTNVLMHLESQNITKHFPVNCENNSSGHGSPNADESELCSSKTIDLQTNKIPRYCQSILESSAVCEKIADGVRERNKKPSAADADDLPIDIEVVPNNKPEIKESSEPVKPDLRVDQTEQSETNISSGAALHCTSAGSTSCGSADGLVCQIKTAE
ncbi:hypothetical protein KIW84_061680 [Lathyrus oleraceus]|uniref:PHD-type domain-containing protein n=1 Tax=Pisum sativum TaxID=3888 RepID=A0A9D5A5I1_PEA|nr:hypothetical protein KIW84_061680 [Pisum sativum]